MTSLYVILGITILALVLLVILWFYLKKRDKRGAGGAEEQPASGGEEIEQTVREAEAKLVAAKLEQGARIANLPVFLLLGNSGSSKTSAMLHSGLEAELLAGQVYQNSDVIATPAANIWFSRRALFVEAGGKLLSDVGKWKRLVRKLGPGRAVMGKGGQAPRAAIVFYDCEAFLQPNAQELAATEARNLRARLGEISQAMGIHLPVYVLFSKMDRLPFFTEYVRNFSQEEASQVLGVTLPMLAGRREGIYAEQETARLTRCFESLFLSLADNRPEFLSRENDAAKLPATYEFPREFRKIRHAAVQFLLDLCRPSQLSVGPFLRGFYFAGVRPVIITESAPVQPPPKPADFDVMSGATQILRRGVPVQAPQAAAPQYASTRKVPQWMFLGHVFNDVLLADRAAQGASGASVKTNAARRILLACAGALCLVFSIGFTVSFFQNRALQARVRDAAVRISLAPPAGPDLASVNALRNLETLRQSLDTLVTYRREGAPWSYRWWLYSGNDLYLQARRLYFARFRQILFALTQNDILENLRRLPAAPGPEYSPTYDALKGYLITTSNHDKSTRAWLPPVLLKWWIGNRKADPERTALAQKQFEFYAEELKEENPFSSENDSAAVEKARRYLAQFAGAERVYAFILAEAGKNNPAINFNRQFPTAAPVVLEAHEVPGAFGKDGWSFVTKDALPHADRYFSGEQWVLGNQGAAQIDRGKLEQDLRSHYYADFLKEWRLYIKSATVGPYTDLKDAAQKLGRIANSDSPLLALFSLASQNTAVDDPAVANLLQPVRSVVPSDSKGLLIAPPNQNYINALGMLQAALESVTTGQADDPAVAQTLNSAPQARLAARQIAQTFRPDSDSDIKMAAQKLLEDPITNVEQVLRGAVPAELNAGGKALCMPYRTLMGKFPFNPNSKMEVSLPELNTVFRKPDGALWSFYEKSLKKVLVKQGAQYVPAPGGTVMLNPAFVTFFNAAAAFSEALYPAGAMDPSFMYTLTPVPSDIVQGITVRIDGQTLTFNLGNSVAAKPFAWKGSGAHDITAGVRFGGPEIQWLQETGLWSLFHFFAMAEQRTPQSLEWIVRIGRDPARVNGKPVTVRLEVDLGAAAPILKPASIACMPDVAR